MRFPTAHKDVFQAMSVLTLLLFNNHGLRGSGESMCVVRIILLCSPRKLDDFSAMSKRW